MTEKTAEEIMTGIKLQAAGSTLIGFSWAMMMGVIYFPSVAEFTYSIGNTPIPNPHERFFPGALQLNRGEVLSVDQRASPPANYDSFFLERWSQCVIRILDGDHVREVPADLVNL